MNKLTINAMRKKFAFSIFIFLSIQAIGQDNNQLNEKIIDCLHSYVNHVADSHAGRGVSDGFSGTFLCKDGLPLDFPYDVLSGIKVISIESWPLYHQGFKKELKKGIRILYAHFSLNGNHLLITVSDRNVRLSNKMITTELSDWGIYDYEYSCDKAAWELTKTQYDGI